MTIFELSYMPGGSPGLAGCTFQQSKQLEISSNSQTTDLRFSPTGTHLAVGQTARRVELFAVPNYTVCSNIFLSV